MKTFSEQNNRILWKPHFDFVSYLITILILSLNIQNIFLLFSPNWHEYNIVYIQFFLKWYQRSKYNPGQFKLEPSDTRSEQAHPSLLQRNPSHPPQSPATSAAAAQPSREPYAPAPSFLRTDSQSRSFHPCRPSTCSSRNACSSPASTLQKSRTPEPSQFRWPCRRTKSCNAPPPSRTSREPASSSPASHSTSSSFPLLCRPSSSDSSWNRFSQRQRHSSSLASSSLPLSPRRRLQWFPRPLKRPPY